MPSSTAFLDSSVILSGLYSTTGGSHQLFLAAQQKKLILITTPLVIQEVTRNLQKLQLKDRQLHQLLLSKTLQLTPDPPPDIIAQFTTITPHLNDAHVLAGATLSSPDFLLSLDKKHLLTPKIKTTLKPIKVFSPKQFWRYLHQQPR